MKAIIRRGVMTCDVKICPNYRGIKNTLINPSSGMVNRAGKKIEIKKIYKDWYIEGLEPVCFYWHKDWLIFNDQLEFEF